MTLFQPERIRSRWDALPNATHAGRDRGWMTCTLLDLNSPLVAVTPLVRQCASVFDPNRHAAISFLAPKAVYANASVGKIQDDHRAMAMAGAFPWSPRRNLFKSHSPVK